MEGAVIMKGKDEDRTAQDALSRLREEISCDFCSLAAWAEESRELKWKLASGNVNDRFASITERAQSGLSHTVVKVGRAMSLQLTDLLAARRIHEYPIMLAEGLRSAFAAPILLDRNVIGVLLAGDRRRRIYRTEERNRMATAAEQLAGWLSESSQEHERSTAP